MSAEEDYNTMTAQPDTGADDGLRDRYLRLAAEFENYKKRIRRDQERQAQLTRNRLLLEWLEIVDSLDRAVLCGEKGEQTWREGTLRIRSQAETLLSKSGVSRFEPTGDRFDASRHEAIAAVPRPGVDNGTIISTERAGYLLREGQVLRPARVVVVKNN